MTLLTKDTVSAQGLAREIVPVPGLNGSVVVQGMGLSARLALFANGKPSGASLKGVLAVCVLGGDDAPLMTEEQWEAFGGKHADDALHLWSVIRRLSGLDTEAVEKN